MIQPHAAKARKASATVIAVVAPAPSGASGMPSNSTSGCGVGAIGMPYSGVSPRVSCWPQTRPYSVS